MYTFDPGAEMKARRKRRIEAALFVLGMIAAVIVLGILLPHYRQPQSNNCAPTFDGVPLARVETDAWGSRQRCVYEAEGTRE